MDVLYEISPVPYLSSVTKKSGSSSKFSTGLVITFPVITQIAISKMSRNSLVEWERVCII